MSILEWILIVYGSLGMLWMSYLVFIVGDIRKDVVAIREQSWRMNLVCTLLTLFMGVMWPVMVYGMARDYWAGEE